MPWNLSLAGNAPSVASAADAYFKKYSASVIEKPFVANMQSTIKAALGSMSGAVRLECSCTGAVTGTTTDLTFAISLRPITGFLQ